MDVDTFNMSLAEALALTIPQMVMLSDHIREKNRQATAEIAKAQHTADLAGRR